MNERTATVVGAGLAGCEAAWQLVKRGVPVKIKRKFAEVIKHSMEQDASTAQLIEQAGQNFRQASGVFN